MGIDPPRERGVGWPSSHYKGRAAMAKVTLTSPGDVPQRADDLSNHRHRQLIGYTALVLPILLIFIVLFRDGPVVYSKLPSVSAYYWTGANAAFVGMLFALALFLFFYYGYGSNDKPNPADRACAIVSALAALGLAFFPTSVPDGIGLANPVWVTRWVTTIHFVSAVVLLGAFAVFALWLFPKTAPGQKKTTKKKIRNWVYTVCGVGVIVCIIWASYNGYKDRPIFWPESFALGFFAIAWLAKGRAVRSIAAVTGLIGDVQEAD